MYGIFTYIWLIFRANVGKYCIHGALIWDISGISSSQLTNSIVFQPTRQCLLVTESPQFSRTESPSIITALIKWPWIHTYKSLYWLVIWNIHGNNMVYSTSVYDYKYIYMVGGLEHEFYDFPFSWECRNPN